MLFRPGLFEKENATIINQLKYGIVPSQMKIFTENMETFSITSLAYQRIISSERVPSE